jgi:hypothetical protein
MYIMVNIVEMEPMFVHNHVQQFGTTTLPPPIVVNFGIYGQIGKMATEY